MAKLGSDKRPAVVRVRTMPKGEKILALCERHHWKVIVGIEPDHPEDLSDIDLLLRGPAGEPPAPRAAPRIGFLWSRIRSEAFEGCRRHPCSAARAPPMGLPW